MERRSMPNSRRKPQRLRTAIVAAAGGAAIAAGAWMLIRSNDSQKLSPTVAVATTASGSSDAREQHATGKDTAAARQPARKLAGTALPPPGAPLRQTYDELKARADAGDAAAASRLFRDTYHCVVARERLLSMPPAAGLMFEDDTSKVGPEQLLERERFLAKLEVRLSDARKESKNCEGLDETQLLVTPIMLEAARLGDSGAGNCYVDGYMMSDPRLFDHPEWLPEYKSNARAIAQASVARGDWGAVAQLQHAYAKDGYGALLLSRIVAPDAVQNYRYLKLRRLGANAENARYYDRDLLFVARSLSADEVAAGDAWAQDAYLRYFSATPENSVGAYNSSSCPDPDN
jgi:hypothetical protein